MKRFSFGTAALLLLATAVWAAVPKLINFQGILRDGSGNPVANGSYSTTFTIYDAAVGGINLWSETQSVNTTNGLFTVQLGTVNPVPDSVFKDTLRWLGIAVSPDPEMTPRQQLVSVAYGFRISSVDGASGGNITSKVSIGPGHTNTGADAFVAGSNNSVTGSNSTVGGGSYNGATALNATVGGGWFNLASQNMSFVGGGQNDSATEFGAVVAGGQSNRATALTAAVGGGTNNKARAQYAVVAGGSGNDASGSQSAIGGGLTNSITATNGTVGGGFNNSVTGQGATVGGGTSNSASGSSSVVAGGGGNVASFSFSTVGGGGFNTSSNNGASVGGGQNNQARGFYSTVGGGGGASTSDSNSASGNYAFIGGGRSNLATDTATTIAGGSNNRARGRYATVGGGGGANAADSNSALGDHSTIGGGLGNTVASSGSRATIGGGQNNAASGVLATVGGGNQNSASGQQATVGGGAGNLASGVQATVGGGGSDTASGISSTVGGGYSNMAGNNYATVGGGFDNTANGISATIGGGQSNTASNNEATVGGGSSNTASGFGATVPGGVLNTALGQYSFAAGQRAKANHNGTFVWGDNTAADFASTAANQFLIRASGGVGIGTNSPAGMLQVVGGDVFVGTATAPLGAASNLYVENNTGNVKNTFRLDGFSDNLYLAANSAAGAAIGAGIIFRTGTAGGGETDRMAITPNGSIGIGTTSPAALLHVNGTAGNNTGVWSNLSDRRLKKEIEPLQHALETVEQLKPVSFRWRDAGKDAQFGRVRGLIAQDVEKVIPEWIKTDPDGYKRIEPIGVDALLMAAIQEQQKTIEGLQAEVGDLKELVEKLLSAERKNVVQPASEKVGMKE